MLCVLLATTAAGASVLTPTVQARRAAPAPHVLAPANSSVRETVCGLAKYPVKLAASKLIGLFAHKDIASLSASLVTPVAAQWCRSSAKLASIFGEAARQQPRIRPHIGPFPYALRSTARYVNRTFNLVTPWWSEINLARERRSYALWYRLSGGRWRPMNRSLYVPHGMAVQFAVRITDTAGHRSPWAYSRTYRYQ